MENLAGEFQIGNNIKPLNPNTVASVVRYGRSRVPLTDEASGYSLVYNQLYPFEGLQNYTSGIIHHVRLTGLRHSAYLCLTQYHMDFNLEFSMPLCLVPPNFLLLQQCDDSI